MIAGSVSVACLIYRSSAYADSVYGSFARFTPFVTMDIPFLFVANDPTDDLVAHLSFRGFPHVVQRNSVLSDDELARRGYDRPEYIRRVYAGWNRAIQESDAEYVVLVNSDHRFSPGWMEGLMAHASPTTVVSSLTVEPGVRLRPFGRRNGTGAVLKDFGIHPSAFDEEAFLSFADEIRSEETTPGGVYMVSMFPKQAVLDAGGFPEGNPRGTCGDRALFERMKRNGVEHITSRESVVYHFQEGEMSE